MLAGRYRILIAAILTAALAVPALADNINDSPDAVSLYARGKRFMRERNWFDAATVFQELEARFPDSPNLDLFVFNRAKARLYLGEHSEAAAGFDYFIARYPGSPLVAYAYHFLGNALYVKGEVNRAVRSYFKAYEITDDRNLRSLLVASLVGAFRTAASISLGKDDFIRLSTDKACALIRPLSEIYVQRGELSRANSLLEVCGGHVDDLTDSDSRQADGTLDIALVLPLSGELGEFGQEIFNGAVIAAELHRQETGRSLKLVPYDTKGEPVEAGRIIGELSRSARTDVVIGPLTSDESLVASATLSCGSLPMIAPAATQAGLTRLSSSAFQLSPNIELEGIALAQYAIRTIGADSAAILSSTAADHLRMTRAFVDHFKRLGGTVVAVEYYRPRDKDFGAYIRDIKAILIGEPADSAFFVNADGDTLDLDVIPARVDCLFVPGDAQQLRQLLPQVHFYNLNGAYLGSDGWGDNAVYSLGDAVTKGAVFCSPFLEGRRSEQYLKLATAFDKRYGASPQRLSALGFDAVNIALMAAAGSRATGDEILAGLKRVSAYEGASGMISFGEYRENIEMPLYRIEAQRAVPLSAGQSPAIDIGSETP